MAAARIEIQHEQILPTGSEATVGYSPITSGIDQHELGVDNTHSQPGPTRRLVVPPQPTYNQMEDNTWPW